jgi:uncharacterized SAM-binding protein YcdF (DUF218 family)
VIARLLEWPLVVGARDPEPRDAIVVLGAPLRSDGSTTSVIDERVAAAVALWRAGGAARIVASGGVTGRAPRSEADAIAEALRAAGVPATAIVIEDASRSTADNARLVAAQLAPLGARTVWIITQPFHGRRAARAFRAAGLDARVWHIAASRPRIRWLVREYLAWIGLPIRTVRRRRRRRRRAASAAAARRPAR